MLRRVPLGFNILDVNNLKREPQTRTQKFLSATLVGKFEQRVIRSLLWTISVIIRVGKTWRRTLDYVTSQECPENT